MNKCSTSVQHKGEQNTNPSICNLQSSHYVGDLSLLPDTAKYTPQAIADEAVKRFDELSLIGYPILSLEQRAVYATAIRLVAERVIDGG